MYGISPLQPAYGRDYKSKAAVLEDFHSDKDFEMPFGGRTNKSDLISMGYKGQTIEIRYKRNTMAVVTTID